MRRALFLIASGLLAALACTSCGDDAFTVRFAPEYPRGQASVSVLGVFKDGRMSAEAWEQLGPTLAASFGSCTPLYGTQFLANDGEIASGIDDYVRANGVTDELLDWLAC